VITDPVTDLVLATDHYRPTEKLRRYLRTRDGRCRCPSCNRSVWRSDIDHTIPYSEGGLTEPGNLACLCPGHHTVKHLPGWSVRQLEPGILEWTTPHGIVAVDRPDAPVRFS
jgi:5-methylcytosine-specific restriction endonuclease McrA